MMTHELLTSYMTSKEAAVVLGCHPVAVAQLVRKGKVPAVKVANRWLIPRAFVEEFARTYVPRRGHPRMKRKYTKRSPRWFQKEAP